MRSVFLGRILLHNIGDVWWQQLELGPIREFLSLHCLKLGLRLLSTIYYLQSLIQDLSPLSHPPQPVCIVLHFSSATNVLGPPRAYHAHHVGN